MEIQKLQEIINNSRNIVFFGGAGVSTESNIPDFRSGGGLYAKKYPYPAEAMLSHDFFMGHTRDFYDFYVNNMLYLDALPNEAHKKLASLEKKGILNAVVTQNIDGLHQKAGSEKVYELHGSVHRNYCLKCGKFYTAEYIIENSPMPLCSCGGLIKPDVVLYGEGLDGDVINGAVNAIRRADTLIVGGTSLTVYPAAGLVEYFQGSHIVLINKAKTPMDYKASLLINAGIGEVFSAIT